MKHLKVYQEAKDSTVTHDGKVYSLNVLFKLTADRPIKQYKTNELSWVLKYTSVNPQRIDKADLTIPILVVDDPRHGLVAIDGAHRLTKAVREHVRVLPGREVTQSDLSKALIKAKKD
jgi:hypothetical protein